MSDTRQRIADITKGLSMFERPYLQLAVYAVITLWALYGCDGSAESMQTFDDVRKARLLEQLPLGIAVGYLLYRAFDVQVLQMKNEDPGSWVAPMAYVAAAVLAGYVIMDFLSYFLKETKEKAKERKQMMVEIGTLGLVFGALFHFFASTGGAFFGRDVERGRGLSSVIHNRNGNVRRWSACATIVGVAFLIGYVDVMSIKSAAETEHVTDSESRRYWQIGSRGLKLLALVLIAGIAFTFEWNLSAKLKKQGGSGPKETAAMAVDIADLNPEANLMPEPSKAPSNDLFGALNPMNRSKKEKSGNTLGIRRGGVGKKYGDAYEI